MKQSKFNQLFKKIIQENNSIINQQYLIVEDIQNILIALNSSAQFSRIREFYKAIYDDSKYGTIFKKIRR